MTIDRPVPIAIVIPSFEPGGTERQMIEVVRRLDRGRWNVHLCCLHARGAWMHRAAETAASVAEFPIRSFMDVHVVKQMRAFAAWCRRTGIEIVQTSELYSNIFALPAAAMARVPVRIGSRREFNAGKTHGQIALQRAAYCFAGRIIANAEAVADRLRRERVPTSKVVVIPNGLDIPRSGRAAPAGSHPRIMMVANLRPEKGHDTLIDAAPLVLKAFPRAHFDLVGGGTEHGRLVDMVRQRGLASSFTFHGHCDNVHEQLVKADIFAFPSRSEAFPNAVLEAMAAGLPVVASSVGGIPEVVHHNQTGLLVTPGQHTALADSLCRLLADSALRSRLSTAARAFVATNYSFERMVSSLERLYTKELARVRPQPVLDSRCAEF